MRIAFFGTPESAVPSLHALLAAGHEIPLVVTQPDRPQGRSRRLQPGPVKLAALASSVPILQPSRLRTDTFLEEIRNARPDALVVVAYGRLLPDELLHAAPHGGINVHFSLLPAYRGAAPVQWALVRGESRTGVSTMRIDSRLDAGDILLQRVVPIQPDEHAPSLMARLAEMGAALLLETVDGLSRAAIPSKPQDESRATSAPGLNRDDGLYRPSWSASELAGRVRGFDPWPGVWADASGRRVRLVDVMRLEASASSAPPGTIFDLEGETLRVACGDGSVVGIRAVQFIGRRAVSARDAVNGRLLSVGDQLRPCEQP